MEIKHFLILILISILMISCDGSTFVVSEHPFRYYDPPRYTYITPIMPRGPIYRSPVITRSPINRSTGGGRSFNGPGPRR